MTQSTTLVPYLPDTAPFSAAQRAWLNGFLAGLFSSALAHGANAINVPSSGTPALPITLVFGSQSGNCEVIAGRTAKAWKQDGLSVSVMDAAQFKVSALQQTQRLVLITSTYGEGEPPDNLAAFYADLHTRDVDLSGLSYSVLALGDRNYTYFCKTGKDIDARLSALGAQRLQLVVECDVDYETSYKSWLSALTSTLKGTSVDPAGVLKPERAEAAHAATHAVTSEDRYTKTNPFPARILHNTNLHRDGAARRTHHIAFSLEGAEDGAELHYEAGDALGVVPQNDPALVTELLRITGFDGDGPVSLPNGDIGPLREALLHGYDITKINKQHIELLAERTKDATLLTLISTDNLDLDNVAALREFLHGREWVDVLLAHPHVFTSPQDFVSQLRKLAPRLYSIASSPKAHSGQVHLTVSVVQYESHGRKRMGVCSNDLARAACGTTKPVFIHPNKQFKLPVDGSAPVIMVGPGTGIAPFRAFLHERAATGARGPNWLFFGCWNARSDFLYEAELTQLQQRGVLNKLDVACSRDQAEKLYVQHLMQRSAKDLWAWLQVGAYFYVCGDAARMARDVDAALHQVAQVAGGLTEGAAQEFVANLRAQKRYLRDVY